MSILKYIQNLIKRLTTTSVTFDEGLTQYVKASYMGKSVTTQVLHDYGFVSSPPIGSLGICVNPRGEENDKASFFFHPLHNVNNLLPGETVIGNFVLKATMYFNAQGQAVVTLPDDLIIFCNNLTATVAGNSTITVAKNSTNTIVGNATTNITGAKTVTVGTASAVTIGAAATVGIGGDAVVNVDGNTTLSTTNLTATMDGITTLTSAAFHFYGPAYFYNGLAVTGAMTMNGVSMDENHTHYPGTYNVNGVAVQSYSGVVYRGA